MIRTKICGITNIEDALYCCELGANALGFVFYDKSPRCVTVKQAQTIIRQLPAFVTTVGLFVNAPETEVTNILKAVSLDLLQFHGDESPEFCVAFDRPYIKAIRVRDQKDIIDAQNQFQHARALLFDAYVAENYGGTGQSFNWQLLPASLSLPWVLSGGLTPDNVSAAIYQTKAQAVDISSGVELKKGVKCHQKLQAFFKGVRHAG